MQIGKQQLNNVMKFLLIICLGYLLNLFPACKSKPKENKTEDKFYTTSTSSWDAVRLPLIKPYELIKLNGTEEWMMNFQQIVGSASNVKEINVIDSAIVLHCGKTYCKYEEVREAWYLIIPDKQKEECFSTEDDLLKYLALIKKSKPELYSVDSVYNQFDKTKRVDWQPGFK